MPSIFTPAARELFFLILVRGRTWRALLPQRLASSAPRSRARPETARPQHDTFSPTGPPPAGRELLCISSSRTARNGTPAARGPTQHARSASHSCVQPETARSLRAVLPAGLYLYPICLSSCCLDTSMQTAADVYAKSCKSETAKTPPNISKSQGPLKHAQQLYLFIFLDFYFSISLFRFSCYLFTSLSLFLSLCIYLSIYLCMYLSICLSIYLPCMYLSTYLSIYLSISISHYIFLCLFIYLCLSLYLSISLSIYFSISLSHVCFSIFLSLYLFMYICNYL